MISLLLILSVNAGTLSFGYPTNLEGNLKPALYVTPPKALDILHIECTVGSETYTWEETNIKANTKKVFEWPRDPSVTNAECVVQARFSDDTAEGMVINLEYSYGAPLSVDLTNASVDLEAKTLSVEVTSFVEGATIKAFGANKELLDTQQVAINADKGLITIPWVGDPKDVVLLDITLTTGNSWASFTYSPWFLDIPHEDILFETNSSTIDQSEEWKLEATLKQLESVIAKYGDMVPINLYIGGCTDTVGTSQSNQQLSASRARSIGSWLRNHGFTYPVYFHGFGENLLAVPTADNVDNQRNRRAIYIVAANPPPSGSGIPQIKWSKL